MQRPGLTMSKKWFLFIVVVFLLAGSGCLLKGILKMCGNDFALVGICGDLISYKP